MQTHFLPHEPVVVPIPSARVPSTWWSIRERIRMYAFTSDAGI